MSLAPLAARQAQEQDPARVVAAAGNDVEKLLRLAREWSGQERSEAARKAWERVLELDADNREAHEGLRHPFYDGRWFATYSAMYAYKTAEDKRMAAKGLARFGDKWVPVDDLPFLKMRWEKDGNGAWVHPMTKARLERERELSAKGWQQQDLEWIDPAEFDQWRRGLWKCGDKWLDTPAADAWHADMKRGWLVAGEHFVVYATVDRARVEQCRAHADRTYADLVRIFGIAPGSRLSPIDLYGPGRDKPKVVVLRSLQQYNLRAAGDEARRVPMADSEGYSSLHYAFFADLLVDESFTPPAFDGAGVAVWDDSAETLNVFGPYAVRHAAAHSFVEAIDPSWNALSVMSTANWNEELWVKEFWSPKRIPRWLRYGAASFVERYFLDPTVGEGEDPRWARTWALGALRQGGGLRDIQRVFDFELDTSDVQGSSQLIHEAGLLVAFILDGDHGPTEKAHEAYREALRAGVDTKPALAELQRALLAAEAELRAFADG